MKFIFRNDSINREAYDRTMLLLTMLLRFIFLPLAFRFSAKPSLPIQHPVFSVAPATENPPLLIGGDFRSDVRALSFASHRFETPSFFVLPFFACALSIFGTICSYSLVSLSVFLCVLCGYISFPVANP
jgi:hypothetical protein